MSLFMDMHTIEGGVSAADVAQAHQADLETQTKYGVSYLRYWVDEDAGKIFCLVEADDAPDTTRASVGWSRLVRTADGLKASVFVRGLRPGGAYTFWWVSPYEFLDNGDPDIPS